MIHLKSKYLIITVDTEEDNQWDYNSKNTTNNVDYLPRFQELAEKYGFKPVWLTTYDIANNPKYVKYFKNKQNENLCEIGMHLHAWNTPPNYNLNHKLNERSFITEYPKEIIDEKVKELDSLLKRKFGIKPVTHRSGRWDVNDQFLSILYKNGYRVDCSITPGIDWKHSHGETGIRGKNYKNEIKTPHFINNILEVPVSIVNKRFYFPKKITSFKNLLFALYSFIFGRTFWFRPNNIDGVDNFNIVFNSLDNKDYIMFMIHSSELAPGLNPTFKDADSIDKLYTVLENVFEKAKKMGYKGITLREYYDKFINEKDNSVNICEYKWYGKLRINHLWFANSIDFSHYTDVDLINIYGYENKIKNSTLQITTCLDLTTEEDILFNNIKKGFRYEINRCDKEKIDFKMYDSDLLIKNKFIIDEFEECYNAMYKEKNISCTLNRKLLESYVYDKKIYLSVAIFDKCIMCFHVYITNGEKSRLLYSCSTFRNVCQDDKNLIGRCNKFLHWKDIIYFKKINYLLYDFGGISSIDNPNGIDKFKLSFGGFTKQYYNVIQSLSFKGRIILSIYKIFKLLKNN